MRLIYCTERERLLAHLEVTLRAYTAAVEAMKTKRGHEFDDANRAAEELRQAVQDARNELDQHRREHGCGYRDSEADAGASD
jgi:hypothetical protein